MSFPWGGPSDDSDTPVGLIFIVDNMKTERAEALIELTDSYVPDLESMDVVFRIVYLPWEQDQGITRDGTGGRGH